jgi:hypothetical protein
VKKLSKEAIVEAVEASDCPMLQEFDSKTATRKELIQHLEDSCCPVLEELAKTNGKK